MSKSFFNISNLGDDLAKINFLNENYNEITKLLHQAEESKKSALQAVPFILSTLFIGVTNDFNSAGALVSEITAAAFLLKSIRQRLEYSESYDALEKKANHMAPSNFKL